MHTGVLDRDRDRDRDCLQAVTAADVLRAIQNYLVNVFDPARANICVTTNATKVDEIVASFESSGWSVVKTESIDEVVQDQ